MGDLERAVEWLRPFVDSKAWDYCVVWKLGDDPSRFIEWLGCCCSGGVGGGYDRVKVKEESGGKQKLSSFCRDAHLKHTVRTKACEALAQFPSFVDLYSGIHGEVVITNQPKWISLANSSDSNPSHQSISTQVLIPVFGGLIQLFAAKHIPEDQNIIELVVAHCNTSVDQRVVPAGSYDNVSLDEQCLDLLLKENLQNFPSPLQLLTFSPSSQVLSAVSQFSTRPYNEGSSSGSNPSIENPSFDSNYGFIAQNVPLKQLIGNSRGKQPKYKNHMFNEDMGSVLDINLNVSLKDNKGDRQRLGRARNLITERNRRNKLKDFLFALRALVPKISKMDRASILGDAAEYIKELLQEVDKLQNELKENEEDCKKDAEMESSKLDEIHEGTGTIHLPLTEHNKNSPGCGDKGKIEVQVEVSQIDKRDFLIKLLCEHERGGFLRLMEAINSLELKVIDANVTTFNGKVLNILRVQAHTENIRLKILRETLIDLTG